MSSKPKKRRRKRKHYPERRKCVQHFKDWKDLGREIVINGKEVTVYTRGRLLEAFARNGCPKNSMTVRYWEKQGYVPVSPIKLSNKYFYTRKMIEAIVLAYFETGNDKYLTFGEAFKEQAWARFNQAVQEELM